MVDTRHDECDDMIPRLCLRVLEDLMHLVSMCHGVYLQALITPTTSRFRLMQLGGHLLHMLLELPDFYISLTKSDHELLNICILLKNLTLQPELSIVNDSTLGAFWIDMQRNVGNGDLQRHQAR